MKVEEIHFNHALESAQEDSISLRENGRSGSEIEAPEWTVEGGRDAVAYAARGLGRSTTIRARFFDGPPNTDVHVRARRTRGVLGNVRERSVTLDAYGRSELVEFAHSARRLRSSGIGKVACAWEWQYWAAQASTWSQFAETEHTVFVTLDTPQWPWDGSAETESTRRPWVEALEVACSWCDGLRDLDAVCEHVTRHVNGQQGVDYIGDTKYGSREFLLHLYLQAIRPCEPPFFMNCTDAANAVVTLSNLLGCRLGAGRFSNVDTTTILPIGASHPEKKRWQYHETAWLGAIGVHERLYDACLQLDLDENGHRFGHVLGFHFGQAVDQRIDDYRVLLGGYGDSFRIAGDFNRLPPSEEHP